jgi:hypothetical protein
MAKRASFEPQFMRPSRWKHPPKYGIDLYGTGVQVNGVTKVSPGVSQSDNPAFV